MNGLLMFASKLGSQKHLVAIRDSFATIMPLIIAGAMAVMLNNFWVVFQPFGLKENFLPPFIVDLNGRVYWGTFAMMTLLIVIMIGYNLAKSYDGNPILTGLVCLGTYISMTPQVFNEGWGALAAAYTNASALFVGLITAIVAAEIFIRLSKNEKIQIKMPEGVPPAVARSFSALIPGIVTLYVVVGAASGIESIYASISGEALNIFEMVNKFVALPLRNVADTLPAALLVAFFNHFLWVFGLHGTNILEGITHPIFTPLLERNVAAYAAGEVIPHIVTKQFFDTYIYLGGSGATLGLLIAIFIMSKSKAKRSIAKLSIGPGVFNINEPVVFGMPIVLNPILAIPFILNPLILTVISYFAISIGFAGRTIALGVWSMPPVLSAIMTTDKPFQSAILQIINIAISILVYIPFVALSDRAEIAKEKEEAENAKAVAN